MASLLEIIGSGRVVSIDLEKRPTMPQHDRIVFLAGRSSTEPSLVREVADLATSALSGNAFPYGATLHSGCHSNADLASRRLGRHVPERPICVTA